MSEALAYMTLHDSASTVKGVVEAGAFGTWRRKFSRRPRRRSKGWPGLESSEAPANNEATACVTVASIPARRDSPRPP